MGDVKLDPWAVVTTDFVFADDKTFRRRSSSYVDGHRKGNSHRWRSPQYINFSKQGMSCCSMADLTPVIINQAGCLSIIYRKALSSILPRG